MLELADQLTLFQPGGRGADYPHLLLLAPQIFSPSGITVYDFRILLDFSLLVIMEWNKIYICQKMITYKNMRQYKVLKTKNI